MVKKILSKRLPILLSYTLFLSAFIFVGVFSASCGRNDVEEASQKYNDYAEVETDDNQQSINEDITSEDDSDFIISVNEDSIQARNLLKLSRVWGFTIYTHQTFLLGERCWDEELLALIPIVRFANEDDINDILYDWFIGLGDDGYDLDYPVFRSLLLEGFPDHHDKIIDFFEDVNNHNWSSVGELYEELWLLNTGFEMNIRPMADLSWINEDYLVSLLLQP